MSIQHYSFINGSWNQSKIINTEGREDGQNECERCMTSDWVQCLGTAGHCKQKGSAGPMCPTSTRQASRLGLDGPYYECHGQVLSAIFKKTRWPVLKLFTFQPMLMSNSDSTDNSKSELSLECVDSPSLPLVTFLTNKFCPRIELTNKSWHNLFVSRPSTPLKNSGVSSFCFRTEKWTQGSVNWTPALLLISL